MTLIPELVSGELYKEHITLMSCTPEPVIWSCDTAQQMPYFDSCQGSGHDMAVQHQFNQFVCIGYKLVDFLHLLT